MGLMVEHKRHSKHVTRTRRWATLRMAILERDGWACVRCGRRHALEVDHVLPVRTHPARAWTPANLQTLCRSCHTKKTRQEVGLKPTQPERQEWRDLVRDTHRNREHEEQDA